jgi:two-component system, response regulator
MSDLEAVDILLVEDNPADVELTLRAFRKNNIANPLHVVGDGEEALDFLFGRGRYANKNLCTKLKLVLLDLKLPKLSGLEVLERIKADAELKKIPVVVLSSSQEEPDIRRSYELGANSYIVKPVDFEKFIEAVSHLGLYWLLLNQQPR